MRSTPILLVILAALPAIGGCATAGNLSDKNGCQVYGGTRLDATLLTEGYSPDTEVGKSKVVAGPVRFGEACCGLVDMPLSMVADTLLLPITVPVAIHRSRTESQAAEPASKKDMASSGDPSAE